jgi:hypothetical protein
METIYRKTDRAIIEIETKAFRLARRLRTALILVDGHTSVDRLQKLIPEDADIALQILLETGYIEEVSSHHSAH